MMAPRFPDVSVPLTGEDGNVFAIIGRVARALRRAGHADAAKIFAETAMAAHSYDAVLRLVMETVDAR
jgi:hypothetical protein